MKGSVLWKIGCFVIVAVVVTGGTIAYMGASWAIRAEHGLHAAILTHELLKEYMEAHDGAWPGSWEDLEKLPVRERRGMFQQWPESSKQVQRYMEIDFTVDVDKIETESLEQFKEKFDAIRPLGPCYPYDHYWMMEQLYETIRKYQRMKKYSAP